MDPKYVEGETIDMTNYTKMTLEEFMAIPVRQEAKGAALLSKHFRLSDQPPNPDHVFEAILEQEINAAGTPVTLTVIKVKVIGVNQ